MATIDSGALVAIITTAGTAAVGAITGLFSWVIRRQSRTVDSATSQKTKAEAVAQEVKTARELLAETREYFNIRINDQAAEHRQEMAHITEQVAELKVEVAKLVAQQRAMAASFVDHSRWDHTAWARILATDPGFPPPPMIEGLL
jgi:uncharacterized protein (DUF3084 family)